MGLWSKVKGVFGRIGKGVKDYFLKPALTIAEKAAIPVGAAVGSIIPAVGTTAGISAGVGASALAKKLNSYL